MSLSSVIVSAALLAHLPSISEDDHGTPDDAFSITDTELSIVLFDTVSCEVPEVWLSFETLEADQEVFMQLGVPVIDRLEDYRPAIAILAPGLPELDLPFEVPEGVGGLRFNATDMDAPIDFFEEFTMTSSWIWYEGTITVPEAGQGWIVAWDPSRRTGKLWVAVGTVEDFSSGIGVTFEDVYAYHEVNGEEPDEEVIEEQCAEGGEEGGEDTGESGESDDAGLDEEGTSDTGGGLDEEGGCSCSSQGSPGGPAALGLALLGLAATRRRRD